MFLASLFPKYPKLAKYNFWKGIWIKEEREIIEDELLGCKIDVEEDNFENIYRIVCKYYIRMDSLKYIWACL